MSTIYIAGIVLLIIAAYAISLYNFFQTAKTRIQAAIQEIGNQLKRQASLIPNLESSVKGYMKHEKEVFGMLTDARKSVEQAAKSGSMKNIEAASSQLQALIPKLQIVVEDNPELKSDTVVTNLMNELSDTADKLTYSRRTVIDLVADYNVKLVTFPSNIIANLFGFKAEKGLETASTGSHLSVSSKEMDDVKVNL